MRLVFAGTPEFAKVALMALLDAGHDVALVLTQPDRPAGRGMKLAPGPVKAAAIEAGIDVLQPRSLRLDGRYPEEAAAAQAAIRAADADVMVVVAYGLILPRAVLDMPRHGCLNIHASLLPRWRGAAPIQRAIEAGDVQSGITVMQMDEGLDTGDMLLRGETPIVPGLTAGELHDRLAVQGGELIVQALEVLARGETLQGTAQPDEGVTYAAKLEKAEAALDCSRPAAELVRRIHAFNPFPGATLQLPGIKDALKVWRASALDETVSMPPGSIVRVGDDGLDVATGQGVLRLLELQKPGGRRQPAATFVRGLGLQA